MVRVFLIFFLISVNVFGQADTSKMYAFEPTSVLKEGIYTSFDQFIQQKPISFIKVVNYDSYTEKENFFKQNNIQYLDDYGIVKTIETKYLWGYVMNNALFIYYNKDFYRVSYLGTLSHFIATQTIKNYASPYDPYYGYYSPYPAQTYETTSLIQNVIDFRSGKIYPFNTDAILALIADDQNLFNEYSQLKKKKKKEMMFYYLRKYNDKHPLYLYR